MNKFNHLFLVGLAGTVIHPSSSTLVSSAGFGCSDCFFGSGFFSYFLVYAGFGASFLGSTFFYYLGFLSS